VYTPLVTIRFGASDQLVSGIFFLAMEVRRKWQRRERVVEQIGHDK